MQTESKNVVVYQSAEVVRELLSLAAMEDALIDQLMVLKQKRGRLLRGVRIHEVVGKRKIA